MGVRLNTYARMVGANIEFGPDAGNNYFRMYPAGNFKIRLGTAGGELTLDTTLVAFRFSNSSNVSLLSGGAVSGDDLVLNANNIDNKSRITLEGGADIYLETDGFVKFGTLTGNADTPVTGYITIKDSGGTARKIAVVDP